MMMNELFDALHQQGVRVSISDGKLNLKLPKDLDAQLKQQLITHKTAFKSYLDQIFSQDSAKQITPRQQNDEGVVSSFAQQRLWFIDSLQGGTPEYNMPMVFEVTGQIDMSLLTRVFNTIIERHEVLRTVYSTQGHQTIQTIRPLSAVNFAIKPIDLTQLQNDDLDAQVQQLVEADIDTAFNLSQDLMLRVSYVQKTAQSGVLIFNMHHIAADGWSMELLLKEFFTLYQAFVEGRSNPLPALEIQYADYALWQQKYLVGEVLQNQLNYWQQKLDQLPTLHSLPLDFARPSVKQHKGAAVGGELPARVAKGLLSLAKVHQLSPFMLLHGALALLLSRHSNSSDIVIGTPMANRLQANLEPLIGFFVNTLVLRVDTQFNTLTDYFAQLRQVHLDAQSNQDVPFEQLVERLKAQRSTAYSPLFQIMLTTNSDFGLAPAAGSTPESLADIEIQPYQSGHIAAKYDLDIALNISEHGVGLNWVYDVSLFSEQHIRQMHDHLCHLLTGLAEIEGLAETRLDQLPMLSNAEINHLVEQLNNSELAYSKDQCIHQLFEQQAQDQPDTIAVIVQEQQLSFKQLNQKANQLAHYLRQQYEITPDTLIGVCLERSLEMVIAILAVIKAGGAYVPIDPSYPQERINYLLKDAAPRVVLSQRSLQTVLREAKYPIEALDGLADSENHLCAQYDQHNLPCYEVGITASNLAYVIYTSGSTGQPKGVMIEHRSLCGLSAEMTLWFDDVKRVGWCANYVFDASLQGIAYLIAGCTLVVVPEQIKVQPQPLRHYIETHEIQLLDCTPSLLQFWLDGWQGFKPPHLLIGGEAIGQGLWSQLNQLAAQGVQIYNVYGPTECTVNSTVARVQAEQVHIGKPLQYMQAYILSPNDQTVVPFGVPGELYLGGDGLARGYLNQPTLTAERFIDNPFYDSNKPNRSTRLYRTGDLVRYLPDGNLAFIGRADDQVKIRGFRIELGEVQAQLAQLAIIDSALVMAKEIAGSMQLVGYIKATTILEPDQKSAFVSQVKATLAQQLPEYMIPNLLIVIDAWPLTPNAKIDRKALPVADGSALQGEYLAPSSETERQLVSIWSQLLSLETSSISATANFFDLGGHSLLTMRLVAEVRDRLAVELTIQAVFEHPQLRDLASVIEQGTGAVIRPAIVAKRRQSNQLPVSFAQQRLWFIDRLQGGSSEYNMPMAFTVSGHLDLERVSQVFSTIIARHEVLRTVYLEQSGTVSQHIRAVQDIHFKLLRDDLTQLSGETLVDTVKTMVESDVTTPFDLSCDLMLRARYIMTTANTGVLLFNIHHIASDGWSMALLTQEFFTLYQAYSQGQPNPLAPLEIQYGDYAQWQHQYLKGAILDQQIGYWQQQLDQLPAVHKLPLDYPRPAIKQYQGAIVSAVVSPEVASPLFVVAKAFNITPFMLLHGALSLLLSRHSNSHDIVIGTPVANRLQTELNPLIGFFVNTLVLRTNTDQATVADYFSHLRQVHLAAQSNQDVPFEQLVERLKVPRSAAHSPLFQIMMTSNADYGLAEDSDNSGIALPDVDITLYQTDLVQAKFDLNIDMSVSERGGHLTWTYDVSLFSDSHIQQLNTHLCRLLASIGNVLASFHPETLHSRKRVIQQSPDEFANLLDHKPYDAACIAPVQPSWLMESFSGRALSKPEYPLASLPMQSEAEIKQLVETLNNTKQTYPKQNYIHQLFERQAQRYPDNVAVEFDGQQLSYQQLNEKSNQLAHYLKEHHQIQPDTLVGLCVERSLEMVIAILAILKAGGAYVPLDPSYPAERLTYMIEDAGLAVVLSQASVQGVLSQFAGSIILLDGLGDSNNHFVATYTSSNLTLAETGLTPSNLAYVIYTSGSTGKPKGVELEHQSVLNYLENVRGYGGENIQYTVLSTSLNFDATVTSLYGAWFNAGYIALLNEKNGVFESLGQMFASEQAGLFKVTPAHLQGILLKAPILTPHVVVVGGEKFTYDLALKIAQQMPNSCFINEYGPTETTVGSSYQKFCYVDLVGAGAIADITIGRPILNTQFLILDQHLTLLPKGAEGELFIGGDGLARGYLNRPELTAQRFIANPFYDSNLANSSPRLYRTGDLVRYLPDGNLAYIGRCDDQVKIRGFRIELGEVEARLTQLESVDSALVMAIEVAGTAQLIGYIKPANQLQDEELLAFSQQQKATLAQQLPDYMVPSFILVVDQWPLTPNGKIDRKALPSPQHSALQGEYIAPATDTEHKLVAIWSELLSLEATSISANANFFELGGHSLLMVKLLTQIQVCFNKHCELSTLYVQTTIEDQALMIDNLKVGLDGVELLDIVSPSDHAAQGIMMIPGVAATGADFSALVPQLQQPEVEIGIFRHKGLIAGENYFDTIEANVIALAACLANKPYRKLTLVGHSYGGALAMSLAQRLSKENYQIDVVLLDSYFEQQRLFGAVQSQLPFEQPLAALDLPDYLSALYRHQSALFNQYQPIAVKATITQVFARQSPFEQERYKQYLGEKLSNQPIHYVTVEGDHFSMLQGASAEQIATLIKRKKDSHHVA